MRSIRDSRQQTPLPRSFFLSLLASGIGLGTGLVPGMALVSEPDFGYWVVAAISLASVAVAVALGIHMIVKAGFSVRAVVATGIGVLTGAAIALAIVSFLQLGRLPVPS